jgi:hypothetical protein
MEWIPSFLAEPSNGQMPVDFVFSDMLTCGYEFARRVKCFTMLAIACFADLRTVNWGNDLYPKPVWRTADDGCQHA